MEETDLEPALRSLLSATGGGSDGARGEPSAGSPFAPLAQGEVRAWVSRGALPGSLREAALRFLTPQDEALLASLSNVRAREERRDARALLRSLLALHLGKGTAALPFLEGEHGKPSLDGGPEGFDFSVSHSGGACAVALAKGTPTGIDLEVPRPAPGRVARLAPRVLDPGALAAFDAFPESESSEREGFFYTQWVMREAVLKATGKGLTIDPRTLEFTPPWRAGNDPRNLRCEVPGCGVWRVVVAEAASPLAVAFAAAAKGPVRLTRLAHPQPLPP